jgi:hypothetical protein
MTNQFQTDYNRYQQIAQVGQIARAIAPRDIDKGVCGEDGIRPGYGVYYSVGAGGYIKPATDADRIKITHIVGFTASNTNTNFTSPPANNLSEIIFNTGDILPELIWVGSVYVIAGETVASGDAAVFNQTTGKWIKYNPVAGGVELLRIKAFSFYLDPGQSATDGSIVEVKNPYPAYMFGNGFNFATGLKTVTVSLTAADIKALNATPFELISAPTTGAIKFISASLKLTAGTEVLAETDDNLAIRYTDGSGAIVSETIETTGFIDQAADTYTNAISTKDVIVAATGIEAASLVLHNTGDGEFTGNASDDAALEIDIFYRL